MKIVRIAVCLIVLSSWVSPSATATLSGYQVDEVGQKTVTPSSLVQSASGVHIVQVEGGWRHSCAVLSSGKLKCWGVNFWGQLGTNGEARVPNLVNDIDSAAQVALGYGHTCALLSNGTVKCWGKNDAGQLGDGTLDNSSTPKRVLGISTAVQLSSFNDHTCAVLTNGTIKCWGKNWSGVLGDGSTSNRSLPVTVSGILTATQVSVGAIHTCALLVDTSVKCWGYNGWSELGNDSGMPSYSPITVDNLNGVVQLELGNQSSCALLLNGQVKCWGGNFVGQLGDGTTNPRAVPEVVQGLQNVVRIGGGFNHYCAELESKFFKCWGANDFGQLGDGTTTNRHLATPVVGLVNASNVAGGLEHSCAIYSEISLKCWGNNQYGQIGDGTSTTRVGPTYVGFGLVSQASQVTVGYGHACANVRGKIKCWGSADDYGALGDGPQLSNYQLVDVEGIVDAYLIDAGEFHTCAVLSAGNIKCWGYNDFGQLGDGTTTIRHAPVLVSGITNAATVSAGTNHTCTMLRDSYRIKCWGRNDFGQLGDGTTVERTEPVEVLGISTATEVSVGHSHACAVLSSGSIKCWGGNSYGQLGDGSTNSSSTPVLVSGISNALSVSAGRYFTCAVLQTGSVKCWGTNSQGQLGDGSLNSSNTPVSVFGINDAQAVSVGWYHSCAYVTGGQIQCWGFNNAGQLGDGTSTSSLVPVTVTDVDDTAEVSAGNEGTCYISTGEVVKCWGGPILQSPYGCQYRCPPSEIVDLMETISPDAPIIRIGEYSDTLVILQWFEPFDGYGKIRDYLVQYRAKGLSLWTTYEDGTSSEQTAVVENLEPFTEYEFRVATVNDVGTAWSDAVSIKTGVTAPGAPEISIGTITSTAISLNWSAPFDGYSPITDYVIQYRLEGYDSWTTFNDSVTPTTGVTVSGLQANNTYQFRVAAVNDVAYAWSSVISATATGFTVSSVSAFTNARGSAFDVTGTGLSAVDDIQIGSLSQSFVIVNDSLIVVRVSASAVSGQLTLFDGSFQLSQGAMTVSTTNVLPKITVIEPYVSVPGAVLTVRGTNVGAATGLNFSTQPAFFNITGRNSLTFTIPTDAINGRITISTNIGNVTSKQRVFVPPRVTTNFIQAGAGVSVVVNGGNVTDVISVLIDGDTVIPSSKSATSVTFTTPVDVETSIGYLIGPGGISNYFEFELLDPPTLDTFTLSAKVGDTITLTGTNLMYVTAVRIGSASSSSFSSTDTTVTFVIPTGATSNKITFSGAAGTVTSASTLTVAQPPKITSISPKSGKVGSTVTINGTNLSNATVTFGTKAATKSTNTATQIKVKVPTGLAKGVVTIKVVTANGEATISFTVT